MSRLHRIVMAGFTVLSLALISCTAPQSTANPNDLIGSWSLVWWDSGQTLPDAPITLIISNEGVSGNASCNAYQGTLAVKKDAFRVGHLGTTLVLCTDEMTKAENTYRGLLQAVTGWRIADAALILSSEGTDSLRFSRT